MSVRKGAIKAFLLEPNEYGRELGETNVCGLAGSFFPFHVLSALGFLSTLRHFKYTFY